MPLPSRDFDPTESAIPWSCLLEVGHEVVFATPDGDPAQADPRMLDGSGLGPWRPVLRARVDAREAYGRMERSAAFGRPFRYDALARDRFDGLLLPGGHAPGMKPYLESPELQRLTARMLEEERPVGAICHGVVVVARSRDASGRPVLHGRRTTALLRSMELSAWAMTCLWLGDYYRTYPKTVQDEVVESLATPDDFEAGPPAVLRDGPNRLDRGFVVRDGNYLSARWPGDAWRFAAEYVGMLQG